LSENASYRSKIIVHWKEKRTEQREGRGTAYAEGRGIWTQQLETDATTGMEKICSKTLGEGERKGENAKRPAAKTLRGGGCAKPNQGLTFLPRDGGAKAETQGE